jgi:hypothetical protein
MRIRNLWLTGACIAGFAIMASAAPIRVGFFKGVSQGRYWNINMHAAGSSLATLLANPDSANLGSALVKPAAGLNLTFYGVPELPTDTLHQLRYPTAEQKAAFLSALDSLDVVIFPNSTGLESIFSDSAQRRKLEVFFKTRGVVGLHWTWQTGGTPWGAWDSLPGSRSGGWIAENMGTLRRDTSAAHDPSMRFLNRGLPDTARFQEKWLSFVQTPAALRAIPGLKATMILDSASLVPSATQSRANQPYSWYRELPEGGRFFYTGLGHRVELFTGTVAVDSAGDTVRPANSFLRRQLYNAILWAAGVDSNGVVSVRGHAAEKTSRFTDAARVSFSGAVEVRSLDGRLAALRRGTGRADHRIEGLRPGVYTVSVTAGGQRVARLVSTP